jgi:hypothetical protein
MNEQPSQVEETKTPPPRPWGDHARSFLYTNAMRELVFWSLFLGSFANALIMAGLLAAGLFEGLRSILIFFGLAQLPEGFSSRDLAAMEFGLRAVELLLLAPLGYIFVTALAIFIRDLSEKKPDAWHSAHRLLLGVKSLSTSLLISVVAADFVSKILRAEPLSTWDTFMEGIVFCLLVGYLVILERQTSSKE